METSSVNLDSQPQRTPGLRVVGIERGCGGQLQPVGRGLDELSEAILRDEQILLLRGAYSREDVVALRGMVLDWAAQTEPWPQGVSASQGAINFHRVDDGSIKGKMAHIFHQFGFGDVAGLPQPLRGELERVRDELMGMQNRLAGTDFAVDDPSFRLKVIRHPRGGGYLVPHAHPFLPQKVSLFLNLSEPGEDYSSGGARFRSRSGEWVDTYPAYRAGDALAWRYSMVHETAPVDPDAAVDWQADDGHWILAIEWVEVHARSSVKA